ncbi:hypothetical protein AB6A40_010172 [Gnathostoma spinigerum]|uniref:Uncharacterized protein n=1 Tax=Gnathostoma spinigerum TaxID=75299 RepID=A0ABD6EUH5_9BILA
MRYSRLPRKEDDTGLSDNTPLMGDSNSADSRSRDDVYLLPFSRSPSYSRFDPYAHNMFRFLCFLGFLPLLLVLPAISTKCMLNKIKAQF